jgi:hypothetical protein
MERGKSPAPVDSRLRLQIRWRFRSAPGLPHRYSARDDTKVLVSQGEEVTPEPAAVAHPAAPGPPVQFHQF